MPQTLLRSASVGDTDHTTPALQIADRRVGATRADTALTQQVARQIITPYTDPDDTVCDPNPEPGLVLTETLRAGRDALGLPTQPRWEAALEANDLARLACRSAPRPCWTASTSPVPSSCLAPSTSCSRPAAHPGQRPQPGADRVVRGPRRRRRLGLAQRPRRHHLPPLAPPRPPARPTRHNSRRRQRDRPRPRRSVQRLDRTHSRKPSTPQNRQPRRRFLGEHRHARPSHRSLGSSGCARFPLSVRFY